MADAAEPTIQTIPAREFEAHTDTIRAVAIFPDGRRMVTGSVDKTLRLWGLKSGVVLKKMEGHRNAVRAVALSRDGHFIASGDYNGELIAWDQNTGISLTQIIKAHFGSIYSLDFSADGALLATGSLDGTVKLWSTATWNLQGLPIDCHTAVYCVRYAPSGKQLAIATFKDVQILIADTKECIAHFTAHAVFNFSLAWMPSGSRLLSASTILDPTIRVWNSSTWKQVGDPWIGHVHQVNAIAVNPTGTLVASASDDKHVRLWRLSDRRTIAIFEHSDNVYCVAFSMDGKHIISGSANKKVSQWAVPEVALLEECAVEDMSLLEDPSEQPTNNAHVADSTMLAIDPTIRGACITGDLATAEELLTQEIDADDNNYKSYANRSFVMARKLNWDSAIDDALKSINIKPSSTGYISKGIALCGKMRFEDATKAFDIASIFTRDAKTPDLLLIKAIAIFNANQHEDAMERVQELAAACPDADALVCRTVEAYLHVQIGINALDGACHDEAADQFTTAINLSVFSPESAIHPRYEDFAVVR
ncbi:WD40-repeat-containing domain protein [Suillus clintonianus]|uniref:WD40-repeat-containing domain protein n=1 Tax=Suillus clintonianus TaxID=1904413 RepID=UPI001B86B690|nr:WD40-repeat-containing domain protein [Suillus clintonianus]KAG2112521.1 WD40-repeat-containing domain protein [Suillus clintonianus]